MPGGARLGELRMKLKLAAAAAFLLCLLLSGCMIGTALYKLPEVSRDFENLQAKTEEALALGAEYSAPLTGTNRQSVQLVDLNGDGADEAVAFFKIDSEDKPLKAYIYRLIGDSYVTAGMIEADGTAFDTIEYVQLDGEGSLELLVGTRLSMETPQVMNVFSINGFSPVLLGQVTYTGYTLFDLDGDSVPELMTASLNSSGQTGKVSMYKIVDGSVQESGEVQLSGGITSLYSIKTGMLSDKAHAVFFTSQYADGGKITDIVTLKRGYLQNITFDEATGCSTGTIVSSPVAVEDINSDQVLEIPRPSAVLDMKEENPVDGCYCVTWKAYSSGGRYSTAMTTFHNISEGWHINLAGLEGYTLTASRYNSSSGTRCTTVYGRKDKGDPVELFKIYVLTGDNRYSRVNSTSSFLLMTKDVTVYAGHMSDSMGMTDEEGRAFLTERFSLSRSAWITGEVN